MHVNHRTSMEAAKQLVSRTHKRIVGRTERVDQAYRHQREQRDKADQHQHQHEEQHDEQATPDDT